MTWRYQATHRVVSGEDVYEVREVYGGLNDDGSLAWTENGIVAFGETKEELLECLSMMLRDVRELPVLEVA